MATGPHPPIGWPLLSVPDEHGELGYPDLAESVRQTIRAILLTRPGEQLDAPGLRRRPRAAAARTRLGRHAPSHPRTGPELARALGATHPARSGRGVGGRRRAVPWPAPGPPIDWHAPASRARSPPRCSWKTDRSAAVISFEPLNPGRPQLRRPGRGHAAPDSGAYAGMDQSASGRSGSHADRAVRLARRRPALPRQSRRAPAAGVPQAPRIAAQAGAAGARAGEPRVRPADMRTADVETGRSHRWSVPSRRSPKPPCCRCPPRPTSSGAEPQGKRAPRRGDRRARRAHGSTQPPRATRLRRRSMAARRRRTASMRFATSADRALRVAPRPAAARPEESPPPMMRARRPRRRNVRRRGAAVGRRGRRWRRRRCSKKSDHARGYRWCGRSPRAAAARTRRMT